MDIKKQVTELALEFQELKKLEMEMKMKMGKYDEKAKVLMTELGMTPEANLNVVEVLKAAFDKQTTLIL